MTVSDSSPLISLARIGAFALLEEEFAPLVIPPAVYREVVEQGEGRPGDPETRTGLAAGWIRQQAPEALLAPPYGQMAAFSRPRHHGCRG